MGWYSNVPTDAVLDTWIKHQYNACFHGRAGVGKTSMVFDAFKRKGWQLNKDYLYFSAATIDPWVDLIGVPSKCKGPDGEDVLKLIRPENVNNKAIKAFFVDEFNRSHKKVRNAMMELVQFKSINGLKFPNLEIVWAAVNPDEDSELKFDVEKLDPAQEDRFHIHVQIPYKPSVAFFAERFNDPDMAEAVCKWWNDQPASVKLQVTPRRLEYAIDVFQKTNDLRFVVPSEAHVSSLKSAIESGNPEKTLLRMIEAGNEDEIRRWLAVENNLTNVQNMICTNREVTPKVLHLLSDERLTAFASKHKPIIDQLKATPKKYARVIKDLAENSTQKMLKEICMKLVPALVPTANSLVNAKVEKRQLADLNLTKRKKAQIINNYRIRAYDTVTKVETAAENLPEVLMMIIMDCSFATNTHQKEALMRRLSFAVSSKMSKIESEACIKIIEYVASYSNDQGLDIILKAYLPVIQSILISWLNNNPEADISKLFDTIPYLMSLGLVKVAQNPTAYDFHDNDLVLYKESDNECSDVPEEPLVPKGQDVNDLF